MSAMNACMRKAHSGPCQCCFVFFTLLVIIVNICLASSDFVEKVPKLANCMQWLGFAVPSVVRSFKWETFARAIVACVNDVRKRSFNLNETQS